MTVQLVMEKARSVLVQRKLAWSTRQTATAQVGFALLALMQLMAAGCGQGAVIVLGDQAPAPFRFDTPKLITELAAPAKTDNPSLTGDLLEIYFTSERSGPLADVWVAQRTAADQAFDTPRLVSELNSPETETSPVVSSDGLSMWLASDRPNGQGDFDVWFSERKQRDDVWSAPINLAVLNSPGKDIPRPIGLHDRVMPLGTDRDSRGFYQIYFATRAASTAPFAAPVAVPELMFAQKSTVDGFLTDDGLTLFYCSGPEIGPADLFVASRRSTSDRFSDSVPLEDLNSASDERDPFLSADGTQFFFSSDRSGYYDIYVAEAHRQPVAIAP